MDPDTLKQKAADLYAAACSPKLSDILYRKSIRALWNNDLGTFDALMVQGMQEDKQVPSRSKSFTLHFLAGDGTTLADVQARLEKKRSGIRRLKTPGLRTTNYRKFGG